jgi:hypothetical protein
MIKCSPTEMRKNLVVVEHFKKYGIDFVPMPVKDELHKASLVMQADAILDDLANDAEDE